MFVYTHSCFSCTVLYDDGVLPFFADKQSPKVTVCPSDLVRTVPRLYQIDDISITFDGGNVTTNFNRMHFDLFFCLLYDVV